MQRVRDLNEHNSITKEQLDLGIIEIVVNSEPENEKFTICHIDQTFDKYKTTKVRIVNDASSRTEN